MRVCRVAIITEVLEMQIDFHHATTYVIARLAGFKQPEAEIIAYAAQYVDDCTSEGTVYFNNKAVYNRISSAHKMLDCRNIKALANHQVWLAFHFLPGNGGKPAGENPSENFIDKIVCRPNSPIAKEMINNAIIDQDKTYALHRLGVVMHIYADTWAHQGFAGVINKVNEVEDAKEIGSSGIFSSLSSFLSDFVEDAVPPLGHGRAFTFPDMPFLSWTYENGKGQQITRNNTLDFCTAAEQMCKAMQRYIAKDPTANVTGLPSVDKKQIRHLFSSITDKDGDKRHKQWLTSIRDGEFSFGAENISYNARGNKSWKTQSLGTCFDLPVHKYDDNFLTSHWKLFHDATQAHRFHIIHDVLPKYGICAA